MKTITQLAIICVCIAASLWFLRETFWQVPTKPIANKTATIAQTTSTHTDKKQTVSIIPKENTSFTPPKRESITKKNSTADAALHDIKTLLKVNDFSRAVEKIESLYIILDEASWLKLQRQFYVIAEQYINQKEWSSLTTLMNEYLNYFQEEQAYFNLAIAQAGQKKWLDAVSSGINAYALSGDATSQKKIEKFIIQSALQYSKETSKIAPEKSLTLFKQLHGRFSENEDIALHLGQLSIATSNFNEARSYLSPLTLSQNIYAEAAEKLLSQIDQIRRDAKDNSAAPQQTPIQDIPTPKPIAENSVSINLIRYGSSYLVNIELEGKPLTLLLDTGASITAIDKRIIRRLNLKRTGRKIKLSTANGIRTASKYFADILSLPPHVRLHNTVIVEINLPRDSKFDGLLGTDILQKFLYQIDNANDRLILQKK